MRLATARFTFKRRPGDLALNLSCHWLKSRLCCHLASSSAFTALTRSIAQKSKLSNEISKPPLTSCESDSKAWPSALSRLACKYLSWRKATYLTVSELQLLVGPLVSCGLEDAPLDCKSFRLANFFSGQVKSAFNRRKREAQETQT